MKRLGYFPDVHRVASQFTVEVELDGLLFHVQTHPDSILLGIVQMSAWLVAKRIDVAIAVVARPVIVDSIYGCCCESVSVSMSGCECEECQVYVWRCEYECSVSVSVRCEYECLSESVRSISRECDC